MCDCQKWILDSYSTSKNTHTIAIKKNTYFEDSHLLKFYLSFCKSHGLTPSF